MKRTLLLLMSSIILSSLNAQRSYVRHAIEEKNEKEHGEPGKAKLNGWLDNLNNVTIRPVYVFTQSVTYHTSQFRRGKWEEGSDVIYYYNAKEQLSAMKPLKEKNNTIIVMDIKPRVQIMFNTEKMKLFAMNANAFMSKKRQDEIDNGDGDVISADLKPTGKSKEILGYTCREYVKRNEAGDITLQYWVANAPDFLGLGTLNFSAGNIKNGINQVILESTHYFHNIARETMVAVKINKKENFAIKSADYSRDEIGHMK